MRNRFVQLINGYLDKLVRPEVHILHRFWPSFQVCGYAGLVLAILLAMILVTYLGLFPWVMSGVIGIGMLTFLGLAMITKIIIGEEQLIYYHHEIAIMIMAAIFLKMINQPVLPYLDVLILGIGMFLVCGRVGCLMGGCCHGRPNELGVCYRKEHAATGFTHYYVGVRLFPIQAVESLWVFGVVLVGIVFILGGRPPGETLAWYVITYDIGRFSFEFVRGDPDRPYRLGFSEAQWTSIVLMFAVIWAELTGTLIFHMWHLAATVGMVLTMFIVALSRKFNGKLRYQFFLPRHVKEIAEAVQRVAHSYAGTAVSAESNTNLQNIPVACTSLGIRLSTQKVRNETDNIRHFAISSQKEMMTDRTATKLADLILKLRYPAGSGELIKGNQGVFHLLIHPSDRNNGHSTMKPEANYLTTDHSPDLRQEIVNGLLYSHGRLNINTQLFFEAQCQLNALIQLLTEKGIITAKELEEQKEIAAQKLSKEFQERGIGVMMQDPAPDKYKLKEAVRFDCANRIHLCRATCCRLSFALSGQDVEEGIVRWNLGQPYMIVHDKDCYCSHLDRESLTCTIYEHQPVICQTYHCRDDKRIWLDFDNMVINPEIIRPDWPTCVKAENVENEIHDKAV